MMQLICRSLDALKIVAKRSYDCLFHCARFLCHTGFSGSFARNPPSLHFASYLLWSQRPSSTAVPNRCLTCRNCSHLQPQVKKVTTLRGDVLPESSCPELTTLPRFAVSGRMEVSMGGDTVSTEAVAARRHAGTHLPVTWWKLELPTTTWHLLLN